MFYCICYRVVLRRISHRVNCILIQEQEEDPKNVLSNEKKGEEPPQKLSRHRNCAQCASNGPIGGYMIGKRSTRDCAFHFSERMDCFNCRGTIG